MDTYLVPAGYGAAEFVEKRSRFIGQVWRVETEEEARERIEEVKKSTMTPGTTAGAISSVRGMSCATATTANRRVLRDSRC